ncbi:class I SAM-dependent RNA methyltransferase [Candidatus Peregrinibacteria bacterium]|nr:class I SAM-dependent RNA methyltransferase [Candidatus Peregrinibacteria bacterium]
MQEPKCKYFGKCGGCATQHLPYEIQLENKKKRLSQTIGFEGVQVFSDEPWHYRNRMDMAFVKGGIGFREKGKWWSLLRVTDCPISNHRLNELNQEICAFFGEDIDAFDVKKRTGTFKYAVIRTPQKDSCISFVLNKDSSRLSEAVSKVEDFAKKTTANNILITYTDSKSSQSIGEDYIAVKGSDMLEETLLGKVFRYSAQGFFQNNSVMAEKMHCYVREILTESVNVYRNSKLESANISHNTKSESLQSRDTITDKQHLLDLYGGVGAFGIVNADLFHKVTSVESYEGCTVAAQANLELNGIKNMEAICIDAKRLKQVKLPEKDLYVITDPPRSGMHPETIIQLRKLKPEVLVYISCNVEQLGKDLPKLTDYKIKSAALFDLFPQTNHMESVIELVLK